MPEASRSREEPPMAAVKPIPDNYPRVTAYLAIDGAGDAIEFYKKIFGAQERFRMPGPDGRIGHAEIQLGDSVIMMADAFPEMGVVDPKKLGGTPVTLTVYVEDVDKTFKDAIKAGAKETQAGEVLHDLVGRGPQAPGRGFAIGRREAAGGAEAHGDGPEQVRQPFLGQLHLVGADQAHGHDGRTGRCGQASGAELAAVELAVPRPGALRVDP